ncbi:MAG: ATP-binding cassette domain-containing protein, partial [Anaerolineales bacterium]|nr:ATP-binding cassette domain-containing protein [Anaerolineales bacterium]
MSLLSATNLSYHYPQNGRGIPPTNLTVAPGEALLISGPSGCGKSTLARCLTGFIPHLYHGEMRGAVMLDGLATAVTPLWQLSEKAGLLFQNPAAQMLTETVEDEILFGLENLGLARAAMQRRLEETLQQFGLDSLRQRDPHTLSGGEQQRLALAAVMARRPPLLVLDEPFSMLDTAAAAALVADLQALVAGGTAVIIAEHRAEYVHSLPGLRHMALGNGHIASAMPDVWPFAATDPLELMVEGLRVERNGRTILHDLSFTASGGQIIALVGRNGVGKTVLARILAGLLPASTGQCQCSGNVHYLAQQVVHLDGFTVADLAGVKHTLDALARIESGSTAAEDFDAVGDQWELPQRLRHELERHHLGHHDIETPARSLSGGEAMRVSLI